MNVEELAVDRRNAFDGCVRDETEHQVLYGSIVTIVSAIQSKNEVVLISAWLEQGRHGYHTMGKGLQSFVFLHWL